jgi:2-aminobenzoate-CoA ligase
MIPAPSAQTDRFVHDRLPPAAQWPQLVYPLPELQVPDQANLVATLFVAASAINQGANALFRLEDGAVTYADAYQRVQCIAHTLRHRLGVQPGNRVLLRGPNSVGLSLAWLAVVHCGAIAVATMPLLRSRELVTVIERAQISHALCDNAWLDELAQAQQTPGSPLRRIEPFTMADAHELLAQDAQPPCPTLADDIALLAFTSGTTGAPKAAVHTHRDVLAACGAWPRHVLKLQPSDVVVGTPPLAFTFGLGGLLIFTMAAGASVHFPSQGYTPALLLQTIGRVGATVCYTAPTFYRQMLSLLGQHPVPRLRISVSAGEALPLATRRAWRAATGLDMLDGIGATEMFHIFISSQPGQPLPEGALGRVVPGYEARVVGPDGTELPRGEVGALAVRGPTGCKYLDDTRQARYVRDGWNYPGDAFVQDADGVFHFRARADDMIVTAGYNVAGPEVEAALMEHPAVAECAVLGLPDDERGMRITALVVPKPGHTADDALVRALQDHVKATIAPYKYPRQVQFVASLPRTETGKLQRFRLRDIATAQGDAA